MDNQIEIQEIIRDFGALRAVDRLSFSVGEGEVVGLLGPNGAGKTTAMRILCGFLSSSGGSAAVCGYDVETHPLQVRSHIGYMPEGAPAYGEMTVSGFLNFVGAVRGLRGAEKKRAMERAVLMAGLTHVLKQRVDTLSKGFSRRLGLAQAILHDPPVLVLDEPTEGLDPNQKRDVRAMIRDFAEEKALLVSTHIMEEVDAVCTRALVIDRGRAIADGTPADLRERTGMDMMFRVAVPRSDVGAFRATIARLSGVREAWQGDRPGEVLVSPAPDAGHTLGARLSEVDGVTNVTEERGTLDEVFHRLTREAEEENRKREEGENA